MQWRVRVEKVGGGVFIRTDIASALGKENHQTFVDAGGDVSKAMAATVERAKTLEGLEKTLRSGDVTEQDAVRHIKAQAGKREV